MGLLIAFLIYIGIAIPCYKYEYYLENTSLQSLELGGEGPPVVNLLLAPVTVLLYFIALSFTWLNKKSKELLD